LDRRFIPQESGVVPPATQPKKETTACWHMQSALHDMNCAGHVCSMHEKHPASVAPVLPMPESGTSSPYRPPSSPAQLGGDMHLTAHVHVLAHVQLTTHPGIAGYAHTAPWGAHGGPTGGGVDGHMGAGDASTAHAGSARHIHSPLEHQQSPQPAGAGQ
jgi:hypothetical protein